jgi:hypothetical protein
MGLPLLHVVCGGWGSCGFQEHICDVNSSACRAYISSFYTFHVFIYFLQLHFRGHFHVQFRIFTPTLICGCTAVRQYQTSTYVSILRLHLAVDAQRSLQCQTSVDISILRLHSSVDVQRSLQCQTSVDVSILRLHSSVDAQRSLHTSLVASSLNSTYHTCFSVYACLCITCLVFKVAKSAWLRFTHQTETSLFSTFYIYI